MLTSEQLKKCLPKAAQKNIELYLDPINKAFEEFEINTPKRMAAFIAQVGHESGQLNFVRENLNYKAESLTKVFRKYFPTLEEAQKYDRNPEKIANKVYASRMGNGDESSGDPSLIAAEYRPTPSPEPMDRLSPNMRGARNYGRENPGTYNPFLTDQVNRHFMGLPARGV